MREDCARSSGRYRLRRMRRARAPLERVRRFRLLVLLVLLAAGLFAALPWHHGDDHADHADEEHSCLACALTPVEPPSPDAPRLLLTRSGWVRPTPHAQQVEAPRYLLPAPRGPPSSHS